MADISADPRMQAAARDRANQGLYDPQRLLRKLLHDPLALLGACLLLGIISCAIFAPQIAPFGPNEGDLFNARQPPFWHETGSTTHLLGTDQLGQDIFSRIIYGTRVSLLVGFLGALSALSIGVVLGLLAGYFGGWTDSIISGFTNVLLSVPYLVLVIVVATILGRSLSNVIILFGITSSPVFVRYTRGEVIRIKKLAYIEAAKGLGAHSRHIVPRHVLPNVIGPLITLGTFEISAMIFYEAGLGFLGLSVPPEVPSWGNMLSLGRQFLTIFPWMAIYPGVAIALTTLSINLLGDWLRDTLDPRSAER